MKFSVKTIAKFLLKEWYIGVGIVAVLSVALLVFYLPTLSRRESLAREKLDKIDALVKSGHLDQAAAALGDFLLVHASDPIVGRAYLMRAEIHVSRGERGEAVDVARNEAISSNLRQAREKGADPALLNAVEWRAAEMLAKHGLIQYAMDRYRNLAEDKEYVRAWLELARLQAGIGSAADDEDLVWEKEEEPSIPSGGEKPFPVRAALPMIDRYIQACPPSERGLGHVVAAEILVAFRCDDDAMKEFEQAMKKENSASSRVRALVGRGMFLSRRGKVADAIRDLVEARSNEDVLRGEGLLDSTDYVLAEAYRVAKDQACVDLNKRLIITGSSLAPLAEISLGRFYAVSGEVDPVDYFVSGISRVESKDLFRSVGLDVPDLFREMSRVWEQGTGDPLPYLKVLEGLSRLYPREGRFLDGQGRIYQRLADDARRRAKEMRERDPAGAEKEDAVADGHYLRAGMKFEEIIKERTRSTDEIVDAHREAAELFRMGKFYAKSAEHYGAVAILLPLEKRRMLFLRAQALRDGGILTTDDEGRPGALEVYDQCIDWEAPAEDVSRKALIGRGEILMNLGRYEQAASVFRLFIDDRVGRFGLTPDAEEWKMALYLDGLCRLNASFAREPRNGTEAAVLLGEARKSLTSFLDRYAAPKPHRLCMAASYDLGRCFAEEKNYVRALECYRQAVRWGISWEKEMTSNDLETFKRASFSVADTLFILDRFTEAAEEYDEAIRRYAASKDRLWGLIGLARCKARMGRREEAMDHLESARNLLRDFRTAFEDSPKGYGVDFWNSVIREVETLVNRI